MPFTTITFGGMERGLDARPDRLDLRDFPYHPPVTSLPAVYPSDEGLAEITAKYLQAGMVLNQGREGACTGFGLAAVVNYLLWDRSASYAPSDKRVSPRMLYHLAQFYDEWPGAGYTGSSCRGALKGWHRHGVTLESLWPYVVGQPNRPLAGWDTDAVTRPLGVYYRVDRQSVVEMQAAIYQTGAIYVSASVHGGWSAIKRQGGPVTHAALPVIKFNPKRTGGHSFALIGYNDRGFLVQNSWGVGWGASGLAILTYEDWVVNGSDSWVVGIGVPKAVTETATGEQLAAPSYFVSGPGKPPWLWQVQAARTSPQRTIWSEQEAGGHNIVLGNDGWVIHRMATSIDVADNVALVCRERPRQWFRNSAKPDGVHRLAIYAHGGLNDEGTSLKRLRTFGPYFVGNDIYPLFITWKSGWNEILGDVLLDQANKWLGGPPAPSRGLFDNLTEATDRALEALLRDTLVKSMWTEMKENVNDATSTGRGLDLLARQIALLYRDLGGQLEIHLMGHSAGGYVCGSLVSRLRRSRIPVKSCTLFAPACGLDFALRTFKPAIEGGWLPASGFRIHVLSERREQDDSVGPYRKSLLYLVSRALDPWHKTPLLGLAAASDPAHATTEYWHPQALSQVREWQAFFGAQPQPNGTLNILADAQVSTGTHRIRSDHSCFDNSVEILGSSLKAIRGDGADLPFKVLNLDY
jgi:papain like protease